MIKLCYNINSFNVYTLTHKLASIANTTTIFNLFNTNPIDYTYIKTSVDKLKNDGVKWIFIDEVSNFNDNVQSLECYKR
jgi:hypothetical protein